MDLSTDLSSESLPAAGASGASLFEGDTGTLAVDTRRVVVQLLLGPSVDGQRQTKLWPVLVRNEAVVRSRLHDMFLELVIDHDQQVAFTRQVAAEDLDCPILLRKSRLSFVETVLLLFLRGRLTHADAQGERAVVSRAEIHEHLAVFERSANLDRARYVKQMDGAIEKLKDRNVLRMLRGDEERMEVAPTLKLLFSAEEIQQLTERYRALAERGEGDQGADQAADDDNKE